MIKTMSQQYSYEEVRNEIYPIGVIYTQQMVSKERRGRKIVLNKNGTERTRKISPALKEILNRYK